MKKIKFLLLFLTVNFSFSATAQLYVQPNGPAASFVYVDDAFIYVEQDVNLVTNDANNSLAETSIILRNEAQLLQGNGADRLNKGTGDLSIFQEGTVNLWDYNFWASPVGLSFNGSNGAHPDGNSDFAMRPIGQNGFNNTNSILFNPVSLTASNPLTLINGFNSTNSTTSNFQFATYWLWSFQSGTDYAEWIHINNTQRLAAGYGFTMKGVNGLDAKDGGDGRPNNDGDLTNGVGQRYDFRGRPNNGDITVPVGPDTYSLVGNPYPSSLDLNYFLLENSAGSPFTVNDINGNSTTVTPNGVTTGVAYFWDSNPNVMSHNLEDYEGGYGTYSPMMGLNANGMYVNATFYMYDISGTQIIGSDTGTSTFPLNGRRFSPVGQGFMVRGSNSQPSTDVVFKNNHRVYAKENPNSSVFRNNENQKNIQAQEVIGVSTYYPDANFPSNSPRIKIGIAINDTYSRELGIALLKQATKGYDTAGDAKIDPLASDVTFAIEGKKGYVINAVPFDQNQYIPITLDAATPSEFRFLAHYTENFKYEGIVLFDRLTETYYDILSESVLIQLDAGEHKGRFFIRFTKETVNNDTKKDAEKTAEEDSTSNDENTLSSAEEVLDLGILEALTVFQNNPNGQLEIHNPLETNLDEMSLFDVTGKLVLTETDLGAQSVYSFPTSSLSTGIYIVQFNTTEGFTKSQKISISN